MPVNSPVLITRAQVGKGPGIILMSLAAPAGELGKGPVENVEVMRLAMTHATFKEIAELFDRTVIELGLSECVPAAYRADDPGEGYARGPVPRVVGTKN